ncbi:bifunctional adenosylcobinamide kinase/adenosylc obinamide-phosphate guanylyltransferase [Desulfonema ishimotonii]|uniref:Adenosylcobinamide kinase n=1 Tax=Desulfonema ishimotonii TaxID=45657 RepID=A0A401G470_9BACT|nr:bifunctional adenosylcobinamide kinase/adenosylcobinamide-phosphate guanylyltransferase [Desulfonema ishimotonii]GBC64014.1 bifunctional adenosylcobinamide kinase/adenosylc obinamide-phosphate guanylyltransferase [Desulfonema ishimotonii]
MKDITFVVGGCRSGKSGYGQRLAESVSDKNRIFIATCVPYDDEMRDRVKKHREVRDRNWTTVEAPILLPEAIVESSRKGAVVLADCLTLWVTNLLLDPAESERVDGHIEKLIAALGRAECPVILVSNEVGCGIVPENKLARLFRDIVGTVNQSVASASDHVVWTVAGIDVKIK